MREAEPNLSEDQMLNSKRDLTNPGSVDKEVDLED